MLPFQNREEAGKRLAQALEAYALPPDALVLALPRGGVAVAAPIAQHFKLSLDVFLVRKLGLPGHEEFAFGAIASGNTVYLNEETLQDLRLDPASIEQVLAKERLELARRERVYRIRPFPDCHGKTVILVDDGIATGATMKAGILALQKLKPSRLIVATPVAPRSAVGELQDLVDDLVILAPVRTFMAIGEFYENFDQLTDENVLNILSNI